MEQDLFSWERSLPASLAPITQANLSEMPREKLSDFDYFSWKFRVILTLRYLNLRVLLHRPVLIKFISASKSPHRDPQDLKLLNDIGMNSLEICTKSAMEIIDIVYQVVSDPGWKQSLLGAWWFSLYYSKYFVRHSYHRVHSTEPPYSFQRRTCHNRSYLHLQRPNPEWVPNDRKGKESPRVSRPGSIGSFKTG